MEKLREAVFQAMRDDSVATVGLRTLLGHAATPYGVYLGHLPEAPDFSTKSYLTYLMLGKPPGLSVQSSDARQREASIRVTAWSANAVTVDRVLRRVENVLENARKVTAPSSECELHDIHYSGDGPDLFDDDFKVHYRSATYRCFYRDDITN